MPGDDPGGWIVTAIIGVAGALIGGFLAWALFDADPMDEFFDISSWLTAIVGSIILLVIYRLVVDRRGGGHCVPNDLTRPGPGESGAWSRWGSPDVAVRPRAGLEPQRPL